jgi:hypothetical protein
VTVLEHRKRQETTMACVGEVSCFDASLEILTQELALFPRIDFAEDFLDHEDFLRFLGLERIIHLTLACMVPKSDQICSAMRDFRDWAIL